MNVAVTEVQVFVKETNGDEAWAKATRKQRREAFAACLAALYIAKNFFHHVALCVDIY